MMLKWGGYEFSIETAPFDSIDHSYEYPWPKQDRLDNYPNYQSTGLETDKLTLKGVIFTHWKAGGKQPDAIRDEAKKRIPQILVTGYGSVLGKYVLLSIQVESSVFTRDGAPKKQTFTLQFERYSP